MSVSVGAGVPWCAGWPRPRPCAVWLAPDDAPARFGSVLAAVDLSPCSAAIIEAARTVASAASSTLHVIHVRERDDVSAEEDLRHFIPAGSRAAVEVVSLAEDGETVAEAILRTAALRCADLIVIGARGANRSAAVLLGVEAEQILRERPAPVLVVKPPRPPLLGVLMASSSLDPITR